MSPSVSTPVLSRYKQQKHGTMNNASWDELPKPSGSTGLSSIPFDKNHTRMTYHFVFSLSFVLILEEITCRIKNGP